MSQATNRTLRHALSRLADLRARAEAGVPPAFRPLVRAVFACPSLDVRSDSRGIVVSTATGTWGPFTCPADALFFLEVLAEHHGDVGLLSLVADLVVRRRRLLDEAERQERRIATCTRAFDAGVARARRDHAIGFARRIETRLWDILDEDRAA